MPQRLDSTTATNGYSGASWTSSTKRNQPRKQKPHERRQGQLGRNRRIPDPDGNPVDVGFSRLGRVDSRRKLAFWCLSHDVSTHPWSLPPDQNPASFGRKRPKNLSPARRGVPALATPPATSTTGWSRQGLTEYLDEMVRFQDPRMESGSG